MSDAIFGRGRRSKVSGYTRPKPSFEGAAAGKDRLQRLAMDKNFDARLRAVETKSGTGTFSSDNQSPVTKPPSQAVFQVTSGGSRLLNVAVTNPEFINPKLNPSRTPVLHQLEYSPTPNFSRNVTKIPVSAQVHFTIPTGGRSIYVRLSSSFDAANFNLPLVSGPHL